MKIKKCLQDRRLLITLDVGRISVELHAIIITLTKHVGIHQSKQEIIRQVRVKMILFFFIL